MTKRALLQRLTIADVDRLTDRKVDEMLVDFLTGHRFPKDGPHWRN
jgi:hypothetical protein